MPLPRLFGSKKEEKSIRVTTVQSQREKKVSDTIEAGLYPAKVASRKGIRVTRLLLQVVVGVLFLVTILSYFGVIELGRKVWAPVQGKVGGLVVSSEVVKVQVKMNGKLLGQAPYTGQGLPAGNHVLLLEAVENPNNYFVPVELPITISPDNTTVVRVNLAPDNSLSNYVVISSQTRIHVADPKLVVRTVPADVSVTIDGADFGKTPLLNDSLGAGAHQVTLQKEGYRATTIDVTVADDKTITIDAKLYPYQVKLELE